MARFNRPRGRGMTTVTSPLLTESAANPHGNYERGPAYTFTPKAELFRLAVVNMVGEDSFYERARDRDDRYVQLVHAVTREDPQWIADFLRWLRHDAFMRTASIVGAAEAVHVMVEQGIPGGRAIVSSVLARPDEPGELLAYWTAKYGRLAPKPIKRGIADALRRLYNERGLIKYDTEAAAWRFGDVIDMMRPEPSAQWQSDLFRYAIDRRHGHGDEIPASLDMLNARAALMAIPVEQRRALIVGSDGPDRLRQGGMTWESLAGWLQGPMDAAAWESIIPSMGLMALIRNLRNFDDADVSDEVAQQIIAKLTDPEEVRRSRQLPMRFLSAYKAAPSLRWGHALEQALQHSLANIPELPGRTLILVDRSGSMFGTMSAKSDLIRADAAAVFGAALALRCEAADLIQFGSTSHRVEFRKSDSVLRLVGKFGDLGGTETVAAIMRWINPDITRVVILTDEQAFYSWRGDPSDAVPANVPLYSFNLAGYRTGHAPSGVGNRHGFAGLTDAGFRIMALLESGETAGWPWQSHATVAAGAPREEYSHHVNLSTPGTAGFTPVER